MSVWKGDGPALCVSFRLPPASARRLEAEKLEGRHFGEASCREYRESVLHVLPHMWDHMSDTRLAEAHFVRHREGKAARKHSLKAKAKGEWDAGRGACWWEMVVVVVSSCRDK